MIIDPIWHRILGTFSISADNIAGKTFTADNYAQVLFTDTNTRYNVLNILLTKDIKLLELTLTNNAVAYTVEIYVNLNLDVSYLEMLIPFSNTSQSINLTNIINSETGRCIYKNYIAGWEKNITRLTFENLNTILAAETSVLSICISPLSENARVRAILNFKELI